MHHDTTQTEVHVKYSNENRNEPELNSGIGDIFSFCLLLFSSLTSANKDGAEWIQEVKVKFNNEGHSCQKPQMFGKSEACVWSLQPNTCIYIWGGSAFCYKCFCLLLWSLRLCPFCLDKDLLSMNYIFILSLWREKKVSLRMVKGGKEKICQILCFILISRFRYFYLFLP